jgi:hypothetical protein
MPWLNHSHQIDTVLYLLSWKSQGPSQNSYQLTWFTISKILNPYTDNIYANYKRR